MSWLGPDQPLLWKNSNFSGTVSETTYKKGGIFYCFRDQSDFGAFIQISKKNALHWRLVLGTRYTIVLTLLCIFLRLSQGVTSVLRSLRNKNGAKFMNWYTHKIG